MELKLKTNKRRLAVSVIIVTLYQTLACLSFTETAECLVERDYNLSRIWTLPHYRQGTANTGIRSMP